MCIGGIRSILLLFPALQKWQLVFFFSLFVSFIQNLPLVQMHAVIFSPTVAQGQVCPGAGIVALQQGARGPRLSHFLQRGNLFMTMDTAPGVHPHAPVPKLS